MLRHTLTSIAIIITLTAVVGCGEPHVRSATGPACAPNCGKADGAGDALARQRLWDLPAHDWPEPLDVTPIWIEGDVLIEGAYDALSEDPRLTAFEAAQVAIRDAIDRPDLSIEDFGPQDYSATYLPSFGSRSLPALVAGRIDDDPIVADILTSHYASVSSHPSELLGVASMSNDAVAYMEVARQVAVHPALGIAERGPVWEYMRQTAGRGQRYSAQGALRTIEDIPPVSLAWVLDEMSSSVVSRMRRNAFVGREHFGLLSVADIDAALEDPDFLLRLDAARHFFAGSDVSESRQADYLALLDDPEFIARVRLDVIRLMGFSEMAADQFADVPDGLVQRLQTYRGAVVGELLRTAPADLAIEPVARLAQEFVDVDPIAEDLVAALRRNEVHSPAEKSSFVAPIARTALEDVACVFLFEQLYAEDSTADVAEDARRCFFQLERSPDPEVQAVFAERFEELQGSLDQRREALMDLHQMSGWYAQHYLAAALLRVGAFTPDVAFEVAEHHAGHVPQHVLPAYVDGGGSAEGLVALLDELVGYPVGGTQPSRMGATYHVAERLLLQAGVEGDVLARVVTDMLATEPGHAFPLWRVFLVAAPGFRSDEPVAGLVRLLANASVTDEAMLAGLARIAAPEGVPDQQAVQYLVRAGVDPHFIARVLTAAKTDHPTDDAAAYFSHVVPAERAPDFDPDLTRLHLSAMAALASDFVAEVPLEDEVDAWLGSDELPWKVGVAEDLLPTVVDFAETGPESSQEALLALRDLVYASGLDALSMGQIDSLHEALTTGAWAEVSEFTKFKVNTGLMLIDCLRGAGYDELRDQYRASQGLRWDLADVARAQSEEAALVELLQRVGPDYGTGKTMLSLAETCGIGADLPWDIKHALAAEAIARHSDLNATYNGDIIEAVLVQDYDLSTMHEAMLRRTSSMMRWFRGIDPLLARWVGHPTVPAADAREIVTLAATMTKRDELLVRQFPSLVRAFVERDDISAEQRTAALALVAAVRNEL